MSADVTNEPTELLLTVPRSSFDLLEGAAEDKGRSRILNAAVLVLVVLVVCTLASRGVLTRLDASGDRDKAKSLEEQSSEISAELAARRRSGEVSKQALDAHISERLKIVDSVAGSELAYARIIREVTDLGPGITVSSIVFGGSGTAGQGTDAAATPTTAPRATGGQPAAKEKQSSKIAVSGTATDTTTANAATSALSDPSKFPYLTTGEPGSVNCSGEGGGGCTWSWNGTITDEGRTDRVEALRERVDPSARATNGGGN